MDKNDAIKLLDEYLEKNNLRKTNSRYKIINVLSIYNKEFMANDFIKISDRLGFVINNATFHNNKDLLLKLGIISIENTNIKKGVNVFMYKSKIK